MTQKEEDQIRLAKKHMLNLLNDPKTALEDPITAAQRDSTRIQREGIPLSIHPQTSERGYWLYDDWRFEKLLTPQERLYVAQHKVAREFRNGEPGFFLTVRWRPERAVNPAWIEHRLAQQRLEGFGNPFIKGKCGEFSGKCSSLMQFGLRACKVCPLRDMSLPLTKGQDAQKLLPSGW